MLVKVQFSACVCLLVCAYVPFCVPEPTPWISGVGHCRDEQSRIKSILILARQEPLFLLGDSAAQGKENKPSFYFLYFCHLFCLAVLRPPALSASSVHCVSLSLSSPFLSLSNLMLPPLPNPPSLSPCLSTVAAPYFSLLCPLDYALQWRVVGTGWWQTALCEVQGCFEIPVGSRMFIKNLDQLYTWVKGPFRA